MFLVKFPKFKQNDYVNFIIKKKLKLRKNLFNKWKKGREKEKWQDTILYFETESAKL